MPEVDETPQHFRIRSVAMLHFIITYFVLNCMISSPRSRVTGVWVCNILKLFRCDWVSHSFRVVVVVTPLQQWCEKCYLLSACLGFHTHHHITSHLICARGHRLNSTAEGKSFSLLLSFPPNAPHLQLKKPFRSSDKRLQNKLRPSINVFITHWSGPEGGTLNVWCIYGLWKREKSVCVVCKQCGNGEQSCTLSQRTRQRRVCFNTRLKFSTFWQGEKCIWGAVTNKEI